MLQRVIRHERESASTPRYNSASLGLLAPASFLLLLLSLALSLLLSLALSLPLSLPLALSLPFFSLSPDLALPDLDLPDLGFLLPSAFFSFAVSSSAVG